MNDDTTLDRLEGLLEHTGTRVTVDADELHDLIAAARERDVLAGQVGAVRAIHKGVPGAVGGGRWCLACSGDHGADETRYPCPTIQALDADGGAE